MQNLIDNLQARRGGPDVTRAGGEPGPRTGRLTVRERVARLLDDGRLFEVGSMVTPEDNPHDPECTAPADGVVTGTGTIHGRPVSVVANDFAVMGGSMGTAGGRKVEHQAQTALREGHPLVMVFESGGHRIQEALDSRHFAFGGDVAFQLKTLCALSGWAPMVALILGSNFAGPANYAAFADIVIMVRDTSVMGIAGPALVRQATGEALTKEQLGAPEFQADKLGMADFVCDTEAEALELARTVLAYLPQNSAEPPPAAPAREPSGAADLLDLVPANLRRAYDVRPVVRSILDEDSFLEIKQGFARNLVTGFARLGGRPVGVVANQPLRLAGCLDADACEKGAHFVSMCDAYGLPLVYFIDTPGLLVGMSAERTGLLRRSAKMIFALGQATVPRFSVVMRKGYGIAYQTMSGGRDFGNDLSLIWPTAEICGMQIEGAVDIIHRREIDSSADPAAARSGLIAGYRARVGPAQAASGFGVDELIDPRDTRGRLIEALSRARRRDLHEPPRRHAIAPI
jgi:acetyl-CoA carboxylase carboxyltransferase component